MHECGRSGAGSGPRCSQRQLRAMQDMANVDLGGDNKRRAAHIHAEQKRRNKLKDAFMYLKDRVRWRHRRRERARACGASYHRTGCAYTAPWRRLDGSSRCTRTRCPSARLSCCAEVRRAAAGSAAPGSLARQHAHHCTSAADRGVAHWGPWLTAADHIEHLTTQALEAARLRRELEDLQEQLTPCGCATSWTRARAGRRGT